jgi:hypothetical protein
MNAEYIYPAAASWFGRRWLMLRRTTETLNSPSNDSISLQVCPKAAR